MSPPTIEALQRRGDALGLTRLDRDVLIAHGLRCERTLLRAFPDRAVDAAQHAAVEALLLRRAAGEPVAYITGVREFWSLPLAVNAATLIPRPDTENLVEAALALPVPPQGREVQVLDLGTGSGAIALAIATERKRWLVTATDASVAALEVAESNARRLAVDNVRWRRGDWWGAVAGLRFDLIVSNPPYVADDDPHLGEGDLRFEPRSALAAGAGGLDALRLIVSGAAAHLRPGGWLLCEHGSSQGQDVRGLFTTAGFQAVETRRDLAGRERVTLGRWSQGAPQDRSSDGDAGTAGPAEAGGTRASSEGGRR